MWLRKRDLLVFSWRCCLRPLGDTSWAEEYSQRCEALGWPWFAYSPFGEPAYWLEGREIWWRCLTFRLAGGHSG